MVRVRKLPLLLLALAAFAPTHAASVRAPYPRPEDRVLVRWRDGANPSGATARFETVRTRPALRISTVRVPVGSTVDETLAALRADPRVLYAEANVRRSLLTLPNPNEPTWGQKDPQPDIYTRLLDQDVPAENQIDYMWALEIINAPAAWNVYPGTYYTSATKALTHPVKVAVLDTGLDLSHPDFINAGGTSQDQTHGGQVDLAEAVSFSTRDDSGNPTPLTGDPVGHGTYTAGIVAAAANNGGPTNPIGGAIGLGYALQVLPIQVLADASSTDIDAELDGIIYAVDHGASVISLSIGDYPYSQAEQDAVDYAWNHGVLVVAAAGNDGTAAGGQNRTFYPAAQNHVLAVAATGPADEVAGYSNSGRYVGIAGPGGDDLDAGVEVEDYPFPTSYGIWSTFPTGDFQIQDEAGTNNDYDYAEGTSGSAPFVAALAGLYMQKNNLPRTIPAVIQTWQAIQRGAANVDSTAGGGWDGAAGFGRIDAQATLLGRNARSATSGAFVGKLTSNGVPVPNAGVTAKLGTTTRSDTTRPDGGFRIAGLGPGTWTVTANTPIPGVSGVATVTVVVGADVPDLTFDLPWIPGDVDDSGTVDVADAVLALRMMQNLTYAGPGPVGRADIAPWVGINGRKHGDGTLNGADVAEILRTASGLSP